MTDSALVLRKLAVLKEYTARARRRRPSTPEALAADIDLYDALSMSLLVAIQEAIDVAFHVVADEGWALPASNAEAFEVLARHGVIGVDQAKDLAAAAGLHNRLAHGYASLDVTRLWNELPAGLDALNRFAQGLAAFVGDAG